MPKYLVLYRASMTADDQMAQSTPEQAQAGMEAWNTWGQHAGEAIVDMGAPTRVIESAGDTGDPIGGFSILEAASREALDTVLDGHPHTAMGGSIEILEFLEMPGMAPAPE